jgi:N6-L-threonylcarbamoyladenine synthase
MSKKPIILGIETSCDETAVSIITENDQGVPIILSNIVSSQVAVHKEFGGVVPELAARSHIEKIDLITKKAIEESGVTLEEIDAVAATAGPGLIVCLSVGLSFGKAMASSLEKPSRRTRIKSKIKLRIKLPLSLTFNFWWSHSIFECSRTRKI